jgi:hypothetical protein
MRGGKIPGVVIGIAATCSDGGYILSGGHIAIETEDRVEGKTRLSASQESYGHRFAARRVHSVCGTVINLTC